MDDERKKAIEQLRNASPLEATKILQQMELYDAKSSQEIIDEVYEQFASGDNMKDEILKPVFLSIIDGLLEATAGGRAARKKGLNASRVLQECESFSYDAEQQNGTKIDAYTEYKNARENDDTNSHMTQEYNGENRSKLYEDKNAMENYKQERVVGEKTLIDEYTGKRNLYLKQDNPNQHYNDETHRKQAQPDHIVPLKQVHDKFKSNYALDDSDIKRIANIDDNFAVTSAEINQVKKELSNSEYIEWMDEHEQSVAEQTKENMLSLQKSAEKAVDDKANEIVLKNLFGKGEVNKETYRELVEKFKEGNGSISKEQRQAIEEQLKKEKVSEIRGTALNNAAGQAKDYAVGNLILFIIKPVYYEICDMLKNGIQQGVGASSTTEALKIRFDRVKTHVLTHAKAFLGDNMWDFVKGFVSSLIEGIISLFVGMFKQILKIIKEGIKIFVQSAKILFGKDSCQMTPTEKGDAIIKLIGGSVIAISGIAIESILNKIGIGDPWSVVLSTMFSGIASALFMYVLDEADLFSTKAEKRRDRIIEIFNERIKDINEAANTCNIVAIETFKRQQEEFETINDQINSGLHENNIIVINEGLYKMAKFMKVDLPYSSTEEFCDYMDSEDTILL
ncbi:DNA repair protein [Clostridium omnivorum]|uniref:DNA repair protein n=1 Tax=Clostridium omnivorum TaxID=1604902 RepID=A0ABQ5N7A8_9CLOT|nr:DNA repair protein [Clostridium sp. E14]GLC31143.1 hypothetical protein bsdE14_25530 [Clostridium sp. E14]